MSGIFAAPSDGYVAVPLLDGERIIHQQTACVLKNDVSILGGQLVITNQRVIFRPLDMSKAAELVRDGIDVLPDGLGVLGKVVDKALDYTTAYGDGAAGAVDTAAIATVQAGLKAAITHPPSVTMTMRNGHRVDIGILQSISSPNFSPANNTARDQVLTQLEALLGASS